MLERLVKNPRHTRSGFPDLTLWNPQTGALKVPRQSLTCVMPLWKSGTNRFAPVVWSVNRVVCSVIFRTLDSSKLDTIVFHMVIGQC